jgi:hypothetical protein
MSKKPKDLSTWEVLFAKALRNGDWDEAARMSKEIAKEEAQIQVGVAMIYILILAVLAGEIFWLTRPGWLR